MTRGIKPSLAIATAVVVSLSVWAGAYFQSPGTSMASAATRFLASLNEEQKAKVSFAYDGPERLDWHFIPRERKGLPIKQLDGAQRALAFGLISTGVGSSGYLKVTTIMSLEAILKELEKGSGPVRDPELYFVSIFGTPGETGKWGWRIEGHHLSLNFAIEDGKILSATPMFFGSNPGEVRSGPRQGLRALADFEDRALRFIQALNDEQKKVAIVEKAAPKDIRAANTPQPPTEAAVGIAYADLKDEQKALARTLVESYAQSMPPEVSKAWIEEIRKNDPDAIKFAWMGETERSKPHAYRVQGPTFLIEYNNTQNNANHVHAVWRNMLGDFGNPAAKK